MSSYVSYDHLKVIGDPMMEAWDDYYGPELLSEGMMVLPFAIEAFYPQTQATEWELAVVRMIISCGCLADGPVTRFDPREFAARFRLSLRQIRRKLKAMEEKGLLKTTPCYDDKGKKTSCKLYDCNPFLDKIFAAMCASDEWQSQQRELLASVGIDEDIDDSNELSFCDDDAISLPLALRTSMSSEPAIASGTSMSSELDMTARTLMSPENSALATEISTSYVRALGSNSSSNSNNINTCINILNSSSSSNSNGAIFKNFDAENGDAWTGAACSECAVENVCLFANSEETNQADYQDDDAVRFERWVMGTIEQEQEQQEPEHVSSDMVACSVAAGQEVGSGEAYEQAQQVEQSTGQGDPSAIDDESVDDSDLPVMLQGRSRAALYHISTELHDAQPHSSRTRARTLYNHLLRINQDDDEYTMSDPDLYFSDLMLTVKHHVSNKTFRRKDGYGQPNGMPLFFHELRKRVEDQVSSVEEMRQQGDYLRMYHERRQISSAQEGSDPTTDASEDIASEFIRDHRAAQATAQLVLTNVQIVEHAQRLQLPMTAEEAQDMLAGTAPELLIEQLTCAVRLGLYYEMIDA